MTSLCRISRKIERLLHDASSSCLLTSNSNRSAQCPSAWVVKTTDPEETKATLKGHRAAAVAIPHKDAQVIRGPLQVGSVIHPFIPG